LPVASLACQDPPEVAPGTQG